MSIENQITYPAQCTCGHLFLEKYQFKQVTDKGFIGFCLCGFCRTKVMVSLPKNVNLRVGEGKVRL